MSVVLPINEFDKQIVERGLGDLGTRRRLSAPAFRAFLDTATFLEVSVPEALRLLGDMASTTYYRYVGDGAPTLDRDVLERISLILGITRGLRLILVYDEAGRRWLRGANADAPFDGRSPLQHMLQGSIAHLYAVRSYIEGWRGGWP